MARSGLLIQLQSSLLEDMLHINPSSTAALAVAADPFGALLRALSSLFTEAEISFFSLPGRYRKQQEKKKKQQHSAGQVMR